MGSWRRTLSARVQGSTRRAVPPLDRTDEIAVDWRLTTQPNSDEQGDTQLKSRSPEVLTPQHSNNLRATQHNSAKLGQFGLLIWRLWVRLPPGSPLIRKDLATSTTRFTEIYSLLVVGSILTWLAVDSTAFTSFTTSSGTAPGAWVTCEDGSSRRSTSAPRNRNRLAKSRLTGG
jgi:hypothetical protein